MSLSAVSLKGFLLDHRGMPVPHGETEFYPNGLVSDFDLYVMLGLYKAPTFYRALLDTVTGIEVVSRRENKTLADEVRLSDWVDARIASDKWIEQGGTAATWTEA